VVQRQAQHKGGRKIRHVVYCSQEQHDRLVIKATAEGVTVAKLLSDSALGDGAQISKRALFNEISAVRRMFNHAITQYSLPDTQEAIAALIAMEQRIAQA
jgi:hypothetical protein